MDITFKTEQGRFNYRVCGMIIHGGKILAMHDQRSPYYYLPGGRVQLGETVEEAVLRECASVGGFLLALLAAASVLYLLMLALCMSGG